jgi:hypothetical protein
MREAKPRETVLVMMGSHKPMLRELGLYLVQFESYHLQVVHKTAEGIVYPYVSSEL